MNLAPDSVQDPSASCPDLSQLDTASLDTPSSTFNKLDPRASICVPTETSSLCDGAKSKGSLLTRKSESSKIRRFLKKARNFGRVATIKMSEVHFPQTLGKRGRSSDSRSSVNGGSVAALDVSSRESSVENGSPASVPAFLTQPYSGSLSNCLMQVRSITNRKVLMILRTAKEIRGAGVDPKRSYIGWALGGRSLSQMGIRIEPGR